MAAIRDVTSGPDPKLPRQFIHLNSPVAIVAGSKDAGPEDRLMSGAVKSTPSAPRRAQISACLTPSRQGGPETLGRLISRQMLVVICDYK